jgi:predicted Fe-Mo cluster-binding NifX family protein
MQKRKVAVPTNGERGMEDIVSDVFGRAKAFTLIEIDGKTIKKVEVIPNPAGSYKHGAGPIVVKTLTDLGVNIVIAGEFGPGVSTLLEHFNVAKVEVKPGTRVAEAVNKVL